MPIYYEAKALERAIDAAPRITPSTKSVLKKIIRSAPAADKIEKLRKERDAAVTTLQEVMRGAVLDGCPICKHAMSALMKDPCSRCMNGSNWEWRGVVDATD